MTGIPHNSTRPPFSRVEYDQRLTKTRNAMAAAGIDLLFVEDPSNMAWLTGYDGWSFYVHQGVVVFLDRDPVWWGRRMDAAGARRTVWMDDDCVIEYADHYVMSPERHPMRHLSGLIEEWGYAGRRVGLELENYYFTAKAYLELQARLPNTKLIDATALVNWQRLVKSGEEIRFMRNAAKIAEKIIDGIAARAMLGLRKNHLVAEIYRDALIGTDDAWGDYPAIVPMLPSGRDAAAAHLTWDDRPFMSGEATFFEIAGCFRRYHMPFCRTVFFGEPPALMRNAVSALKDGLEAGLEVARPGNRACDVYQALTAPLERAGLERGARAGYSIGLSYPPDWGERTVSIRAEDETILEPAMTFHLMPGIWMNDWGLEITEPFMVEEGGPARCFCNRPRDLIVIG